MWRTFWCTALGLVMLFPCRGAAQERSPSPSRAQQPAAASRDSSSKPGTEATDRQAMKEDLERMQAILNQMRTNLAFVGNSTTPLNHQFQLEIDLWQTLLNQMQRRLSRAPEEPGR